MALFALRGRCRSLVTVGIVAVLLIEQRCAFFAEVQPGRLPHRDGVGPGQGGGEGGQYGVLPAAQRLPDDRRSARSSSGCPSAWLTAIYLSEYANPRVRAVVKPTLEVLAGIPTVVVGFFALNFITPTLLRPLFGDDRVFIFNAAAGAIAVGLMVLPLIASISEDAMRAVPQSLREAAFGMGASKRAGRLRVVVPAALSGIAASVILAFSRAVGETMAVTIAAGNSPKLTTDFFDSIQTLTAYIAQTVSGEAAAGTVRYQSLFAVGHHPVRPHAGHEPRLGSASSAASGRCTQ